MATTLPGGSVRGEFIRAALPAAVADLAAAAPSRASAKRRTLSPDAGRAIEMLGHAIEYLADEFALDCMTHKGGSRSGIHPTVQAIELLKRANRAVYFSCPVQPNLTERFRALFRSGRA